MTSRPTPVRITLWHAMLHAGQFEMSTAVVICSLTIPLQRLHAARVSRAGVRSHRCRSLWSPDAPSVVERRPPAALVYATG
jgi:hypothetical protein